MNQNTKYAQKINAKRTSWNPRLKGLPAGKGISTWDRQIIALRNPNSQVFSTAKNLCEIIEKVKLNPFGTFETEGRMNVV